MSRLTALLRRARGLDEPVFDYSDYSAHPPSWFEKRRPSGPLVDTAAELYQSPEQLEGIDQRFCSLIEEPETLEALRRDTAPIPALDDRGGYFDGQDLTYWLSGLADLRMVQRLVPEARFDHVLDFGGSTGRWHVALAYDQATVTVADLNVNNVEWVERNFGPALRAVKVSPYPYFPLGDNSVTFCVGLSVFTHIDSYETGWLAEIYRVQAWGGYALLTIHSEDTWPLLSTDRLLFGTLQLDQSFQAAFRLGEPMPAGRHVYAFNPNSIEHNCNVFVDSDYVQSRWGRWFEVVDIVPRAHHGFQAAVVLRKV